MYVTNLTQAMKLIGVPLYWDSSTGDKTQWGVLTNIHKRQLHFNHEKEGHPLSDYTNLRTTRDAD